MPQRECTDDQCCRSNWGEYYICDDCLPGYKERYPQGWHYYPGDICKHGVYVGGCGIDWMCGMCEMGEE